jgi:predicted DNA binding CopG/RHH family protein
MKKRLPEIQSDQGAEALLEQDLSGYLSADNFTRVSFEFLHENGKPLAAVRSLLGKQS